MCLKESIVYRLVVLVITAAGAYAQEQELFDEDLLKAFTCSPTETIHPCWE